MKMKIAILALFAVITGVFAFMRPKTAPLSELKDAVNDSGFSQDITALMNNGVNGDFSAPAPSAPQIAQTHIPSDLILTLAYLRSTLEDLKKKAKKSNEEYGGHCNSTDEIVVSENVAPINKWMNYQAKDQVTTLGEEKATCIFHVHVPRLCPGIPSDSPSAFRGDLAFAKIVKGTHPNFKPYYIVAGAKYITVYNGDGAYLVFTYNLKKVADSIKWTKGPTITNTSVDGEYEIEADGVTYVKQWPEN